MALDFSGLIGRNPMEPEQFLHLDDVAFNSGDFTDADNAPLAVAQPLQLNDKTDCRGNLRTDTLDGHRKARHSDHLLQT